MKSLLLALALISAAPVAKAETITLSNADSNAARAALPARLISLLTDAGVTVIKGSNGLYSLKVEKLVCKRQYRTAVEPSEPLFGIESSSCFVNAENDFKPSGTRISQGAGLYDLLDNDLNLGDCAMGGRCLTWVKALSCTIDTKIEVMNGPGRFTCELVTE